MSEVLARKFLDCSIIPLFNCTYSDQSFTISVSSIYFWNMSLDHDVLYLCVSEEKTNQLLKREGKIDRFPNK